jgi:hypothetical protein
VAFYDGGAETWWMASSVSMNFTELYQVVNGGIHGVATILLQKARNSGG